MANKFLSIYVGADAIRIAEMQKNSNKTVILTNAAEIATPGNAVNDGYLIDITAIAEAIKTAIFGRGFTAKDVIFTVNSKKIASKDIEVPYVKQSKKLQSILQANSGEYFPMSNANDYAFAYSILEDMTTDEGRKNRVSAVAAPADLLQGYYELADDLKFKVASIDYFGNSVIQLLSMQMTEGHVDLVLQIEKDATFVNVMRGKTLILQRNVPYGKNAVISALMDVKKISEKDAKTLLSNEMLMDQHVSPAEYAETVRFLVQGIGRVVEYHRSKNPGAPLQGIKIFGEGSAIAGIEKILQRELGAPVEHFETLSGVTIKGQAALTAEEVLRYLPNIGAVIDPINLEIGMESAGPTVDNADLIKYLRIVLGVAFIGMAGWTGYTAYTYHQEVKRGEELQAKIDSMAYLDQLKMDYDNAVSELAIVKSFEASTHSDNEYILTFIADLEELLPNDTVLSGFTASEGDINFSVESGWHTTTKNEVADVMVEIGGLPYVSNFWIPEVLENYQYRFLIGTDEEGNAEYLREKPDLAAGEVEGETDFVLYTPGEELEDPSYAQYMVVRLTQTTYDVRLHIGAPVTTDEEGGVQ